MAEDPNKLQDFSYVPANTKDVMEDATSKKAKKKRRHRDKLSSKSVSSVSSTASRASTLPPPLLLPASTAQAAVHGNANTGAPCPVAKTSSAPRKSLVRSLVPRSMWPQRRKAGSSDNMTGTAEKIPSSQGVPHVRSIPRPNQKMAAVRAPLPDTFAPENDGLFCDVRAPAMAPRGKVKESSAVDGSLALMSDLLAACTAAPSVESRSPGPAVEVAEVVTTPMTAKDMSPCAVSRGDDSVRVLSSAVQRESDSSCRNPLRAPLKQTASLQNPLHERGVAASAVAASEAGTKTEPGASAPKHWQQDFAPAMTTKSPAPSPHYGVSNSARLETLLTALPLAEDLKNIVPVPDCAVTASRGGAPWGRAVVIIAVFCAFCVVCVVLAPLMFHRPTQQSEDPMCQTTDCVRHAALLAYLTANDVDACEDFAKHVCSAYAPPRIEKGQYVSAMDAAIYTWFQTLAETLHRGTSTLPIGRKPLNMHTLCMGDDSKYGRGTVDFLRFMNEIGLASPFTSTRDVDALDVFVSLAFNYEASLWFSLAIAPSLGQQAWRVIISPSRYLHILMYFHQRTNEIAAYGSYWAKLLSSATAEVSLDVLESAIRETVTQAVDIVKRLYGTLEESSQESALLTLPEINNYIPYISPAAWLKALQQNLPFRPTMTTEVFITDVDYMRVVASLLQKHDNQQLLRHLYWLFVLMYGPAASPKLLLALFGDAEMAEVARPLFCGLNVEVPYKSLVSALHYTSTVSAYDRALVDACFDSLVATAVAMVTSSEWLDPGSKVLAASKILAIRKLLWPDEVIPSTQSLENIYEDFPENETSFTAYWILSHKAISGAKRKTMYQRIYAQPLGGLEPYMTYDAFLNHVLVAIGSLVRPLYSRNGTNGMLYGGIGFMMALEIIKSLDRSGLRWHPNGSFVNSILSAESTLEFAVRDACPELRRHSSVFPEIPAVEVAYAAFQEALKKARRRLRIAGHMTEEKVFFITLCFMTCRRRYVPSPYSVDCNKALQNFPEFAKAFSCPSGSNMNPVRRCRFFD
ncbi:neprilysin-2-like [Amblyomma americanum]